MDDLDRAIDRRNAKNPTFRKLLAAETKRLELINSLVVLRKKNGLSQADAARAMGVGQSVVAEIESGQIDVRYTTLDRYVSAVSREKARLTIGRVRAVGGRADGTRTRSFGGSSITSRHGVVTRSRRGLRQPSELADLPSAPG